jgi:SnoaL-like domain
LVARLRLAVGVIALKGGSQCALASALRRPAFRPELQAARQLAQQLQQRQIRPRRRLDPVHPGFGHLDGAAAHGVAQDRLQLAEGGLSLRDPRQVVLVEVQQHGPPERTQPATLPAVRSGPLPPVAVVVSFIDCVNRGDVEGLGRLMTVDHELRVFDEPPLVGRDANIAAWRGYLDGFPAYLIYPHRISEVGGTVAVLGYTTGSHLGLPDAEESRQTVIWLADVVDGALRSWVLVEDSPANRQRFGLQETGRTC